MLERLRPVRPAGRRGPRLADRADLRRLAPSQLSVTSRAGGGAGRRRRVEGGRPSSERGHVAAGPAGVDVGRPPYPAEPVPRALRHPTGDGAAADLVRCRERREDGEERRGEEKRGEEGRETRASEIEVCHLQ